VLPLLLVLTGGIVQIGTVIATKHTLIQVGRDLGRWAATQDADDCLVFGTETPSSIAVRADEIAVQSRLMGYVATSWRTAFTSYDYGPIPDEPPTGPGVEVSWLRVGGADCPPQDSLAATFVTVRLAHEAPVLVPGLDLLLASLPGLGSDGAVLITTSAQFRMEPQAEPADPGT